MYDEAGAGFGSGAKERMGAGIHAFNKADEMKTER